jgi:predicted molibdopterin-dependent oxidoreductase YjgC
MKCPGRLYLPIFTDRDRWIRPITRCNGKLVPVSGEKAVCPVITGFRRIIDTSGPGAVGFYGSAMEKNRAKMIVLDPRRTQTAAAADIYLQIRTGINAVYDIHSIQPEYKNSTV